MTQTCNASLNVVKRAKNTNWSLLFCSFLRGVMLDVTNTMKTLSCRRHVPLTGWTLSQCRVTSPGGIMNEYVHIADRSQMLVGFFHRWKRFNFILKLSASWQMFYHQITRLKQLKNESYLQENDLFKWGWCSRSWGHKQGSLSASYSTMCSQEAFLFSYHLVFQKKGYLVHKHVVQNSVLCVVSNTTSICFS